MSVRAKGRFSLMESVRERNCMRKRFCLFLFLILICLGLAGCSREPVYYTEDEIMQYVQDCYGKNYRMTGSNRHELTYGEHMQEYIFSDGEGFSFSVTTGTMERPVLGGLFSDYSPTLTDSYVESRIAFCEEEIKSLFEEFDLRARLTKTGRDDPIPGTLHMISLYLNKPEQIREASRLIAKLDRIVKLSADRSRAGIGTKKTDSKQVHIYLRPDHFLAGDTKKNWRKSENLRFYEISSIALSTARRSRLDEEDVQEQIRHDYADCAKWYRQTVYTLPEGMAARYPSPYLEVTRVGTRDLRGEEEKFYFLYDRETESYWMTDLDLCQDYDGFPYAYPNRGRFAALIGYMGGLYSCDDLKASWKIGGRTWDAELVLEKNELSDYAYESMTINCNGMWQKLSTPPTGTDNGTVSGRWYSIEDLIRMLDVEVTISQEDQSAILSPRGILDQK